MSFRECRALNAFNMPATSTALAMPVLRCIWAPKDREPNQRVQRLYGNGL